MFSADQLIDMFVSDEMKILYLIIFDVSLDELE